MRRILGLAFLAAAPALGATWQPGFEEVPVLQSSASLSGGQPVAVGANGRLSALFQITVDDTTSRVGYVARGADGTWSDSVVLSADGNARDPSVAVDHDGYAHAVWEDVVGGQGDIVYRAQGGNGIWSEPISISPAPGASHSPVLAVDAFDRVHAVWVDARSGFPELFHSTLSPGGAWEQPGVISVGGDDPGDPSLCADAIGAVHVVWRERIGSVRTGVGYNILYLRIDATGPPGPPVRLIDHVSIAQWPAITAAADGVLHLVWADNRDARGGSSFEIYYKRYLPGIGWGRDKRFTRGNHDHSRPTISVGAESTVNVAWEDFGGGNSEIYFRQITPEFGWDPAPSRLSQDISSSQNPVVAPLPDGKMIVLWTDAQGFGELRLLAKTGANHAPR